MWYIGFSKDFINLKIRSYALINEGAFFLKKKIEGALGYILSQEKKWTSPEEKEN